MGSDPGHLSGGALTSVAVVAVLLLWRVIRMGALAGQSRPLDMGRLWIGPLLYLGLGALVIGAQPPQGLEWLWLAAGAALGGSLGWWRGKTIEIVVHPGTGALSARTSSAGAVFLVGLIALRYGLRYLLVGEAGPLHLTVKAVTSLFLAFALGLMILQRVEMTLRANRLLTDASAAGPGPQPLTPSSPTTDGAPAATTAARAGMSNVQLILAAAAVFVVIVIVGLALPR